MSTASTVTGNTSKAIERHLSSSYQVVLYVAKNLDKIDSAINLMDYFAAFYLGAHTTPPTNTPSGNPLTAGVFYLNVNDNTLYFWTQVNGVFQWTDLNDVLVNVVAEFDAHAATVTTTFTELAEGYDTTFLTYLNDTQTYRNETALMYQEILLMHAAILQAYEHILPLLSHIAEIQVVSEHITEVAQVGANINAVITVSNDIAAILAVPLQMAEIRQAVTTTTTNAQKTTTDAAAALASKNAAALSETNANAHMVASKASEDAAKLSELAAYASELSSAASAQDAEASETAAATAEVNSIANATASYNYFELARGYANDAEVSKGESQASAEEAEVYAQESIVNADAAKVSELAAKASEVASKASEVASKTSETNSKASELAAKASETIATTMAAQTTADATLTAGHVSQTASNVVLAVAAKDAAEAAASVVTGGIIDKGAWDASTGVFPDKPTRPLPEGGTALVSAFWKVTVSGTVEGISFLIGDDLRFSASTDAFYKVDNTDAVASVQGKTGAVTLTASEVGALATPTGTHAVDTVLVAGATAGTSKHSGYTLAKSVPSNALFTDTIYTHPTTDGNLHVPATGTTNNGKVLAAGSTAGSAAWKTLTSADINGLDVALLLKLDATANAVSATKLQNAVTINGVAFDGSANITITAANPTTLTRGTGLTGANYNGASATTWAVAYGSAAGTACQGNDARLSDARTPLAHSHGVADVTGLQGLLDSKYSSGNTNIGTGASNYAAGNHLHTDVYAAASHTHPWAQITGAPATATRWPTLAEIGAQPAGSYAADSHTHDYLPLTGGVLTGELVINHQRLIMAPINGAGSFGVVKHQTGAGGESWLTAISDTITNHNAIGISQNEGPKCWINRSMHRIYHQGFKPTPADIGAQPAGSYAAASHTHDYAPSVSATLLGNDSTVVYGRQGLQVSNFNGVGGTGANGTQLSNPTNEWYHHITLNTANAGGYYVDIAACFHSNILAFRRVASGVNYGWMTVYHTGNKPTAADVGAAPTNHTHSYAPLTGAGTSGTWPINVTGTSGGTTGNAATATTLQTARTINGVSFNGSANITITAAANGGTSAACSGNSATATLASTVAVNGSASNAFYDMLWREGNAVFIANAGKAQLNPATGDMRLGGHVAFAYASDEDLKVDICEITDPLAKVCSLRTATYLKRSILPDEEDNHTYTPETGFIAQDLEKVIPNLISVNDYGYKTINGGGFEIEALLAGAIKELKKQHDSEIAELKAQIAALAKLA